MVLLKFQQVRFKSLLSAVGTSTGGIASKEVKRSLLPLICHYHLNCKMKSSSFAVV